jgi:hypothetical protein
MCQIVGVGQMAVHRARRVEVTEADRAADTLARPDYGSVVELVAPDGPAESARWWARAVFEGAPAPVRWFLRVGWSLVLRLAIGPPAAAGHVLGWSIEHDAPDLIILAARGKLVTAHNLVLLAGDRVRWVTFVRFEHPVARAVWAVAAPVHHQTIPRLLRRAAIVGHHGQRA